MKRQSNDQITSRVYSYGSVPARVSPVINEDLAQGQLYLANRLWNLLVRIERYRVARYLAIMRDEEQEQIDALKEKIRVAIEGIKVRRKAARARKGVGVSDLQAVIDEARADLRPLIAERKTSSYRRHTERKQFLDANSDLSNRRIKRARQAAASMGLYWGTYNEIIQRADAGRKHGGELHFRGFRGQGTLTAQVMGGAAVERCVDGNHTVFQIGPPVPLGKSPHPAGRIARMRIGSNEDRSPVWIEVPIVYHREIPADANIRSVSVTRRIEAGKVHSKLNVTVNVPRAPQKAGPTIAVDIGWRLLPEGVRVAYWVDDRDRHGQVLVPQVDLDKFVKVSELRSLCDGLRNQFLPPLAEWLSTQELSEEWKAKSAHLIQWRSGDRLAAFFRWWGDHRLAGDEETWQEIVFWRKRYLHLTNWWRGLQDQSTRDLLDRPFTGYRPFAARVAREYGTLIIEQFDLREVIEIPEPDSKDSKPRNRYRQFVSPSVFRLALTQACAREGVRIVKRDAAYTTRACHVCGYEGKWDQAASVMHRCERCGTLFDQDHNASQNLLRGPAAQEEAAGGTGGRPASGEATTPSPS